MIDLPTNVISAPTARVKEMTNALNHKQETNTHQYNI